MADCIGSISLPTPPPSKITGYYVEPELAIYGEPMELSIQSISPEEENVLQLINQGIPSLLLNILSKTKHPKVLISSIRALKNIFSASCSPTDIEVCVFFFYFIKIKLINVFLLRMIKF